MSSLGQFGQPGHISGIRGCLSIPLGQSWGGVGRSSWWSSGVESPESEELESNWVSGSWGTCRPWNGIPVGLVLGGLGCLRGGWKAGKKTGTGGIILGGTCNLGGVGDGLLTVSVPVATIIPPRVGSSAAEGEEEEEACMGPPSRTAATSLTW